MDRLVAATAARDRGARGIVSLLDAMAAASAFTWVEQPAEKTLTF
jgi:hypothetical protein